MITFFYNNKRIELERSRSDLTVLEWLRLFVHRTGTKEGCASGDCGACTVVVARVSNNDDGLPLHFEAINSCIAFVGSLHGCALFTVEDLANGDDLHPVQTAMVQQHGSQCGFCTPGFIMSMFALYQQQRAASSPLVSGSDKDQSHSIDRYLGGNLCRCTGYRPIKAAMMQSLRSMEDDADNVRVQALETLEKLVAAELLEIPNLQTELLGSATGAFLQPRSLDQLEHFRRTYPRAKLLAGGTDLALEVTQQLKPINTLIDLNHVPELLDVQETEDGIRLGAAVTLTRCLDLLENRLPGIKALLLRYGSEQVRNAGTIGGNIANASPIGDFPPALIAANARVCLGGPNGSREIPLEEFFIEYKVTDLADDEWVQSVFIPQLPVDQYFSIHKISKRFDDDISAVCAAFSWAIKNGCVHEPRIVFGGMAATPKRASAVEAVLDGNELSAEVLAKAKVALSTDFQPIDDARASAQYRLSVAGNLIQRVQLNLNNDSTQTYVLDYEHR